MSLVSVVGDQMPPWDKMVKFMKEYEVLDMSLDHLVNASGHEQNGIRDVSEDITSDWLMEEILAEERVYEKK